MTTPQIASLVFRVKRKHRKTKKNNYFLKASARPLPSSIPIVLKMHTGSKATDWEWDIHRASGARIRASHAQRRIDADVNMHREEM